MTVWFIEQNEIKKEKKKTEINPEKAGKKFRKEQVNKM